MDRRDDCSERQRWKGRVNGPILQMDWIKSKDIKNRSINCINTFLQNNTNKNNKTKYKNHKV